MHTIMVLGGGLLLLTVFLLVGYWRQAVGLAALCFIPLWFAVASINMWVGVTKAGYSFMQEVPFFLLVSLPLTAIALVVWCKNKAVV